MPFSDIAAFNLVIVQTLSDCLYVISHSDTVCDNSIGVWKCSSKNCTSCRTTYRLTGISILITDALLCQSVKIWRLHLFISITANHIFSCCVCHQYYNLLFHSCSPFHSMDNVSYLSLHKFSQLHQRVIPPSKENFVSFTKIVPCWFCLYPISPVSPASTSA